MMALIINSVDVTCSNEYDLTFRTFNESTPPAMQPLFIPSITFRYHTLPITVEDLLVVVTLELLYFVSTVGTSNLVSIFRVLSLIATLMIKSLMISVVHYRQDVAFSLQYPL